MNVFIADRVCSLHSSQVFVQNNMLHIYECLKTVLLEQDPNVKLIRELRAENARLRALLNDATVCTTLFTLVFFGAHVKGATSLPLRVKG